MAPHNFNNFSSGWFLAPCGYSNDDEDDTSSFESTLDTTALDSRIPMPSIYAHDPAPASAPPPPTKLTSSPVVCQPNLHRSATVRVSANRRIEPETFRNRSQRPPRKGKSSLSEEDKRINRIILEAKRHQVVSAHVSNLSDFQTMSVTLPAAEDCRNEPCHTPRGRSTSLTPRGSRLRAPSPRMFRGKKAWTSSSAADSFVSEAKQADRYYQRGLAMACQSTNGEEDPTRYQLEQCALSAMADDEEDRRASSSSWKAWLPKKWTAPKSTLIEV